LIVFVLVIARRQHKRYSSHLAEVTRISEKTGYWSARTTKSHGVT